MAVTALRADGAATVLWSPPANATPAGITGYRVTASPGGATVETADRLRTVVAGLTNGTSYTFTVQALNGSQVGPPSAPSNAVVPGPACDRNLRMGLNPQPLLGGSPTEVVSADFNGDGRPDLAVIQSATSTVSLLLAVGGGLFGLPLETAFSAPPTSLAVGDFNGDTKSDLATTSGTDGGEVTVLLGVGDGTFQSPTAFLVTPTPGALRTADFDGDATLDVVLIMGTGIGFFHGEGDGTFTGGASYPAGNLPRAITAADFNGDQHLDLAVAVSQTPSVNLLFGNGDGTFQLPTGLPSAFRASGILAGQFNGDTSPDLVVTNESADYGPNVLVHLGAGDGGFSPAVTTSTGGWPTVLGSGDFDGDQRNDLILGYRNSGVMVWLARADGTFGNSGLWSDSSSQGSSAVAADFDGDAKLDVVVANPDRFGDGVQLFTGDGLGGFSELPQVYVSNGGIVGGVLEDFNQDQILDLALADFGGSVVSLSGSGNGTFSSRGVYPVLTTPYAIARGDFNGDGFTDLATPSSDDDAVKILLGKGDATFTVGGTIPAGFYASDIAVADYNEDGHLDLAVSNWMIDTVSILVGNGDGTFQPSMSLMANFRPKHVRAGDFDRDRHSDLIVFASSPSILKGNGDATFRDETFPASVPFSPTSVEVIDVDNDGMLDLLMTSGYSGGPTVFWNQGDGGFEGRVQPAGSYSNAATFGDFDGDAIPDIALSEAGRIRLLRGEPDGGFRPAEGYSVRQNFASLLSGDLDRDGRLDLVLLGGRAEPQPPYRRGFLVLRNLGCAP